MTTAFLTVLWLALAAEAQVAALTESRARDTRLIDSLTQERDDALAALHPHSVAVVLKAARAEAAEAALATTRQALAEIADDKTHTVAWLQDLARHALAATGTEQEPA